LDAYPGFRDQLNVIKTHNLDTLTWPWIIKTAQVVVKQMPVA
jgi:hypothetical protein